MFEIDKAQFGRFLSAIRKEKKLTQKELAQKLMISDKAVSKWERGLSLPDISLLMPLADIFDITVTELLEGRRMESAPTENTRQVEDLVKKALAFSEQPPQKNTAKEKQCRNIFVLCILAVAIQWLAVYLINGSLDFHRHPEYELCYLHLFGLCFLAYFLLFAKERLPSYYDENQIHVYTDGFFKMNLPGIRFHNRNWPHILRVCRIWSVIGTTVFPVCYISIHFFIPNEWKPWIDPILLPGFAIGGLFLPVYVTARKYQ